MKKILLIAFILLTAITLSGCKKKTSTNETTTEPFKETEKSTEKKIMETEALIIKGSDTLLQVVSNLIEEFSKENPKAELSVTGGGSGTGVSALINGEIKIANSSRDIKEKEIEQAKAGGVDIYEYIVARDGLSVIVNPDNPINEVTLAQLGEIFKGAINNWGDAKGNNGQIVLYGRQNTSGTYEFFRDVVVKDDYAATMRNMEGSQAIIDAVKNDKTGIGYVGIGYVVDENGKPKDGIKILKVAKDENSEAILPLNKEVIENGTYALTRPLYHFLSEVPEKNSITHKLLIFEAAATGTKIIEAAGFFAPNKEDLKKNNELLNSIK